MDPVDPVSPIDPLAPAAVVRAALAARGEAVFRVRGTSMWPLLPDGALVRLRPVAPAALGRGDVIAVDAGGGLRVHRFLGRAGHGLLRTRGDALDHDDPPAATADLVGRVVALAPRALGGRFLPVALDGTAARLLGLWIARLALPALGRLRRLGVRE